MGALMYDKDLSYWTAIHQLRYRPYVCRAKITTVTANTTVSAVGSKRDPVAVNALYHKMYPP